MKHFIKSLAAACVAGSLGVTAFTHAEAPAAVQQGDALIAMVETTATVAKIDYTTRDVMLRSDDGQEFSFVASEQVENLPQVQVGDRVSITYAEALAYEVKKGGTAADGGTVIAGGRAEHGAKPAGALARETKVTVLITAIDAKTPSVTFQGPGGNTRTIKVRHPEKLKGVSVGDTVEITYTEAVAVKVEAAPKQ